MKIGNKVSLITASGEKHIGTVLKVFPEDILTLTIIRPKSGGITQKYHRIPKIVKKPKANMPYWSEIKDTPAPKKKDAPKITEHF